MICLQDSPVGFDTIFSSPMSSDNSTASTFVTQVVEEDSVQQVLIYGRVEEVSRGAIHVHVFPVFGNQMQLVVFQASLSSFC